MRIAYRGNFGVSFSTESHIRETLISMGHTVVPLQENKAGWQETIAACNQADLFLWTCTNEYAKKWARDEPTAVALLNETLPTAAVHLDLFFGLDRANWVEQRGWFRLSHVFTADGDHPDEFSAMGVNHHWLPPGVYHAECELGTPRAEYRSDVAFVGAWRGYHGEWWPERKRVLDLLRTYDHKFWPTGEAVRGRDLNDLYASCKIAVGDSCFATSAKRYVSDRAYEAPGRGAFSLFPRIKCVEDELTDGVHCVFYTPGDMDDLKWKIDRYLGMDDERQAIRKAGSAYVREHCSYVNRMQQMLEVIGV